MTFHSGVGASSLRFFLLVVLFDPLRCSAPATNSLAAQFPPAMMITEGKTAQGFPYLSGGISTDERERMEEMGKAYNLKLVFAAKKGPFIAGVRLVIEGEKGAEIINLVTDGPWFYIQLPTGVYRLRATFEGQKKEVRRLAVSKGKRIQRNLVWDLSDELH
jgi:hypothetical protein